MKPVTKKLKVSHYPQIPCTPFEVEVKNEYEAILISNVLANQHLYLYENKMIPDYSNAIVISMLEEGNEDEEDNGWVDYYNDEEYMDFDEIVETYFTPI